MLTVIGTRKARTFRVLWMLEELGLDYKHDPAQPRGSAAVKANPSGKIPTLLVDDTAVPDSTAIITYLSDAHQRFTHSPGSLARARQDAFTFAILDEVDSALWTAAKHSFVLPEDRRVPDVKPCAKWEYQTAITRLSEAMQGPYLMGDEITVPDFILVHCLGWAKIAGFPEPDDRLSAYMMQAMARPAFQRAAKLP